MAVRSVLAASALFCSRCLSCASSARSCPMSSACCRMMSSFLSMMPSSLSTMGSPLLVLCVCCASFTNISPVPTSNHVADTPYICTVFCNTEVPTLLLPFEISVIIDVLQPTDDAKAFLSDTFPSLRSSFNTSINLLDISFFSLILQNTEFYYEKNLVDITEYCIFAAL